MKDPSIETSESLPQCASIVFRIFRLHQLQNLAFVKIGLTQNLKSSLQHLNQCICILNLSPQGKGRPFQLCVFFCFFVFGFPIGFCVFVFFGSLFFGGFGVLSPTQDCSSSQDDAACMCHRQQLYVPQAAIGFPQATAENEKRTQDDITTWHNKPIGA